MKNAATARKDEAEQSSKGQPGKRAQTKANNRQAILDAGRIVFAELGYGATTVRDIIRRTGLASGTFYNYFRSKEEVFEALLDQNALRVRPKLREARATARNFDEFIRHMFQIFFDICVSDELAFSIMRRSAGQMHMRVHTTEIIAGFEELRDDIASAIEKGLLPPVDVGYLTASFVGVAFEMADELLARENPNAEEAAEFAAALFLDGIKALPQNT